jgi:hypothetical protein
VRPGASDAMKRRLVSSFAGIIRRMGNRSKGSFAGTDLFRFGMLTGFAAFKRIARTIRFWLL